MQNLFQLKQEMCEIGYRIWLKGFCAGNEGNHSCRISDDRVLCTPTGLSKGFLKPDMVTVVDMDGNQVDKENKYKRTSEVLLHLAIYKKRPDVRAVIHSHPPHATAFAMSGIPVPEGLHPEAEVFLGKIPTAPYKTPSYAELGQSVCDCIGEKTNTVLMGNHGSVSFADTLISTYYKLEILDAYCRILLLLRTLGKVNFLSQQEMVDLLKVKESFGMPDPRLACAPSGCVGTENEPFLSLFQGVQASAISPGGGGAVTAANKQMSDSDFEGLVQRITDQILTARQKA